MKQRSPLEHGGFRTLLLAIAGLPILLLYAWRTLIFPLFAGALPADFGANYMAAAARIAGGRDPYDICVIQGCAQQAQSFAPLPLAGAQYVTPPPVAWMLQPLVGTDPRLQLGVVIAVLQLSVLVFLVTTLRAVQVPLRDWQMVSLLVLVTISFEPVAGNFDEGQINLVLLALSGVWALAWVGGGDRWWGGVAAGLAVAIKLLQAPLGLLILWRGRWRMLAGAVVAGAGLWLLAVPQYLPEYLFKVAPVLTAGTGLFENHSPGGTVIRLFDPNTFLGAARDTPIAARVITTLIAIAALAVTFRAMGGARGTRSSRALEAAAIVAAGPLVASYSWGTHLVLLLLPMLVLIAWSLHRRDRLVLALVAAAWLLIGPGHKWFQTLLVSGYGNLAVLRLMAEFGVVGVLAIWAAALLALRRERSADRFDPADEDRPEKEENDRARENRPVARVR